MQQQVKQLLQKSSGLLFVFAIFDSFIWKHNTNKKTDFSDDNTESVMTDIDKLYTWKFRHDQPLTQYNVANGGPLPVDGALRAPVDGALRAHLYQIRSQMFPARRQRIKTPNVRLFPRDNSVCVCVCVCVCVWVWVCWGGWGVRVCACPRTVRTNFVML